MARTNRNGGGSGGGIPLTATPATTTSVDALDNLNLDDMFADGGDDLFDELDDMNLADMDDITGAGGGSAGPTANSSSSALQSSSSHSTPKKSRTPSSATNRTASAPMTVLTDDNNGDDEDGEGGVMRRRKTKRKSKAPVFYEDADDDYGDESSRKKRKTVTTPKAAVVATVAANTTSPKKKSKKSSSSATSSVNAAALGGPALAASSAVSSSGKAGNAAIGANHSKLPTKSGGTSKSKSSTVASGASSTIATQKRPGAPNSTTGTTSSTSGMVAAAGQFGGRQKSKSLALPTQKNKSKGTGSSAPSGKATSNSGNDKFSNKNARAALPGSTSQSSQAHAGALTGAISGISAVVSSAVGSGSLSGGAIMPTLTQILAKHPGLENQSQYCGIMASNTLFYPFLPTLPTEPTLKSRKLLPLIDRVHSSFLSQLQTPGKVSVGNTVSHDGDAIFQLLQEAFKDDKPSSSTTTSPNPAGSNTSNPSSTSGNTTGATAASTNTSGNDAIKKEAVGNAVASIRKTIFMFDKTRLAGDLYAVCALVKRQHDFLKQNLANMERWCRDNFPEKDYSLIYVPVKGKKRKASSSEVGLLSSGEPSVLHSFATNKLRVKLACAGLKDAKYISGTLVAILPQGPGIRDSESGSNKIAAEGGTPGGGAAPTLVSKTKKRKITKSTEPSSSNSTSNNRAGGMTSSTAASADVKDAAVGSGYAESKPSKRRKLIADLLARTARELESTYLQRLDDRRQVASKQESELRTMIESDDVPVIHTQGMWRWLDKSGYFDSLKEADITKRLDGIRSPESGSRVQQHPYIRDNSESADIHIPEPTKKAELIENASLSNRLIALLVEEDSFTENDEKSMTESHDDDQLDLDLYEEWRDSSPTLDLTQLSPEERTLLQLKAFGLVDSPRMTSSTSDEGFLKVLPQEKSPIGPRKISDDSPSEVEVPVFGSTYGLPKSSPYQAEADSKIEDIISAMTGDLINMNALNNRRCNFVEALSMSCALDENVKRKSEMEAALILKCQQVLKKGKEAKAKNGKPKPTQSDELGLPW